MSFWITSSRAGLGLAMLNSLEIPNSFPICDRIVKGLDFAARGVDVEFNDSIAKSFTGEPALVQQISRVAQRSRQGRKFGVCVGIAFIQLAAVQVFLHASHARRDHGREGEI